jgi:hypothetical protein
MANYNSKVQLSDGTVLIDLTNDTVDAASLAEGKTAHGADGALITGINTYDSDTSEDTATAPEILSGKTAHARGNLLTGSMPNNGAVSGSIADLSTPYTVPAGYHDGSGTVGIDNTEASKLIPSNIREGITIMGVEGELEPSSDIHIEPSKTATPTFQQQTILPATGYDAMAEVVLNAIPVTYTENAAGGYTVTIG